MSMDTTDQKSTDRLQQAIRRDSRLAATEILAEVQEGTATLRGTVSRLQEKWIAGEVAGSVEGIREVENRLRVAPRVLRGDEEIADELSTAIAEAGVDDRYLVITVAGGSVHLSGSLLSESDRRELEEIAARVEGVVELTCDLAVSTGRGCPPDRAIEREIRAILDRDAEIPNAPRITVRSVAGTVRLEGPVSSAGERQAAERDARRPPGVVYVDNRLTLEESPERPAA